MFTYQEPLTISGFTPSHGEEGDFFVISGEWLRDVDKIYFVDTFEQKTEVTGWDRYINPELPGGVNPVGAPFEKYGFNISGRVPETLPKVEIEKFPRFNIQVENNVSYYRKCCFEIQKDLYTIHEDTTINGDVRLEAPVAPIGVNEFLVRGTSGLVQQRNLDTFMTGVNKALISELALSVQMNWVEFTGQFVTSETMDTKGNCTSSEGVEVATIWVEPLKSDTHLLIDVDLCVTASELTDVACAIFKDGSTTPVKMWSQSVTYPDQIHTLRLRHIVNSTAAGVQQRYNVRVGVAKPAFYNYRTQKVYVNRCRGTITKQPLDLFGEQASSVVWIREMKYNPTVDLS